MHGSANGMYVKKILMGADLLRQPVRAHHAVYYLCRTATDRAPPRFAMLSLIVLHLQAAAARADVRREIPSTATFSVCEREEWGVMLNCSGYNASGRAEGAIYVETGRFYCNDCWNEHGDGTNPFNFDDQGCGEYADDDHEPKDHELGDPLRTLPQFIPCS